MTGCRTRRGRKHVFLSALAVALVLMPIATACGEDDDASAGSEGGEKRVIGYSLPTGQEPQLTAIGRGMDEAIDQLGLNWEVSVKDSKLSPDRQVSDIDSFVNQKTDALVSWTLDPGAADAAYGRAKQAEMAIVGINSESDLFDARVQTETDWNGCVVSKQQVEYIKERQDDAKVLVLGGPPVPSIKKFTDCFVEEAKAAGLEIVDTGNDVESTGTSGQRLAEDLLTENPDVNVVWAFGDTTALGASAALRSAGKSVYTEDNPEGVLLLSRNGAPEAIAAIESGEMTASWDSNQVRSGAAAIQVLKLHFEDGVPLEELPKVVDVPSTRWDSSNAANYVGPSERKVELVDIPKTAAGD